MITYATSSVFAPILQNTNKPIILLALQPLEHLDYSKANTFMQLENQNYKDSYLFTSEGFFISINLFFASVNIILLHR